MSSYVEPALTPETRMTNRIMSGILDQESRKKLLAITQFPALHDAVNLCRSEEAAAANEPMFRKGASLKKVQERYKRKRDGPTKSCNKCGYQAHSEQVTCPAIGKEYKTCKKIGHFATVYNASKAAVRVVGSGMRIGMIANGKAARKVPKISINLCNPEGQSLAVASAIPDCGAEASVMGVAVFNLIGEDAGNLLHRDAYCWVRPMDKQSNPLAE